MTAFANRELSTTEGHVQLQIRSVNSRYLDIVMRLPDDFRQLEMPWREHIKKRLARGKVDVQLQFMPEKTHNDQIQLDETLVQSLLGAGQRIKQLMCEAEQINPMDVLRWPGVIIRSNTDAGAVITQCKELMSAALDEFIAHRQREGNAIKLMIKQRLEEMDLLLKQLHVHRPDVLLALRQHIYTKLQQLSVKPDRERFEQELVLYAQKLDVDEELDRIAAHIQETCHVLERDEAIGRRLDFLMQEFNREVNTLSSKSCDTKTTQIVVDMKVLIEQIREQVQNIE